MKHLSHDAVVQLKAMVFLICSMPLIAVSWRVLHGTAGADPVEALTHTTGLWALRLLLVTLALSPARKLTGWCWLVRLRRIVALYAFSYATLHTAVYLWFEQDFDWPTIAGDVLKRPWLTAGCLAFVMMIPLAMTSTNGMMKRLGRNWQRLHRLVYPIALGAVLHYFWLVKRDITAPSVYAVVLAVLLCARLVERRKRRSMPSALAARHTVSSVEC